MTSGNRSPRPDPKRALALAAAVREHGFSSARIIFLDYNGIARARSVNAPALPHAASMGVNFSSPTVEFNSREEFPAHAAFDLASPDVWAVPDARTLIPSAASSAEGQLYASLVDAAGEPWIGCPRTALARTIERAAAMGMDFHVGFEPEAYLLTGERDFAGSTGFATAEGLDRHGDFARDLIAYLDSAGIEVPQWSEEYGPGQIEVNLRHGSPLVAADNLVTFRLAFRAIAQRHGMHGTFMPKPFEGRAGTGLHVHVSATGTGGPKGEVFDDPFDLHGLSALGRSALAGILAHGPALVALGASTVNSYKRFLPGSWAPTHGTWAYASRAAFVRVPERETTRRLELRAGDGCCNPYLYLTAILAAALDGVERGLDAPPPVPGDVGSAGDLDPSVARLPSTLAEALDALERDETIRAALPDPIGSEFIKVKRSEWDAFRLHVGQWDRDWYLERY